MAILLNLVKSCYYFWINPSLAKLLQLILNVFINVDNEMLANSYVRSWCYFALSGVPISSTLPRVIRNFV